MHDLKHYGQPHRRAADHPADGFCTGVSLFVFTLVMIFYGLGVMP
jgi:hypothetical protein